MESTRRFSWLAALLLCSLAVAGCAGASFRPEQPALSQAVALDSQNTVGQTLTAHYDGLNSLHVYLSPLEAGDGQIVLRLRSGPTESSDLLIASLPVSQVTQPGYYAFEFPPLHDSTRKDYYALLEIPGEGGLEAGAAEGQVYLFGALYQNGQPQDAQLTFGLGYEPRLQFGGLLQEGLTWALWLLTGVFLFVLPGWALLEAWRQVWAGLRFWERFGLACGVSLAIYPLLILWTDLAGLHLGAWYAWLPPLIGLAVMRWRRRRSFGGVGERLRRTPGSLRQSLRADFWPGLAMLIVVGLIAGSRLWVIRRIDLPMWGDSYQHTMIAQLLVDHAGLFDAWTPYAELTSMSYHFGFHAIVAAFQWVTRLPMAQATLVTGQFLNLLAVIALYPLATKMGRNAWAGVIAVLVAGLIAPMPMYYLNWGRYTQLAGQVMLPAVVLLAWAWLESTRRDWPLLALGWIALGGLALTHVRVLFFAVAFVGTFFVLNLRRIGLRPLARRTFWYGIGGVLLSLPWLLHLYAGEYMRIFTRQVTTPPSQMTTFLREYNALGDVFSYLPAAVWLLLLAAVAWGLWRRERDAAVVSLWWLLLLLAANPQWLGLPGAGALSSFAVLIAAYIPAGTLIGAAAGWAIDDLKRNSERRPTEGRRSSWLGSAALMALIVAGGAWGARKQLLLIDPLRFSLATRADLRAMQWIGENTPSEAGFLVNSFFAYGDSLIAGSDGGWWTALLTERGSTQPPLNYGVEEGPIPDYRSWINEVPQAILDKGLSHPETLALLGERGIGYVYIGQQQGSVNSPGPLLDLSELQNAALFEPVYHQDRVWIFKVK